MSSPQIDDAASINSLNANGVSDDFQFIQNLLELQRGKSLSTFHRKYWLRFNSKPVQDANVIALVSNGTFLRYLEAFYRIISFFLNIALVFISLGLVSHSTQDDLPYSALSLYQVYVFHSYFEAIMVIMGICALIIFLLLRNIYKFKLTIVRLAGFSSLMLFPTPDYIKLALQYSQKAYHQKNFWFYLTRFLVLILVPVGILLPACKIACLYVLLQVSQAGYSIGGSFAAWIVGIGTLNQFACFKESGWTVGASMFLFRQIPSLQYVTSPSDPTVKIDSGLVPDDYEIELFHYRTMKTLISKKGIFKGFLLSLSFGPLEEAHIAHHRHLGGPLAASGAVVPSVVPPLVGPSGLITSSTLVGGGGVNGVGGISRLKTGKVNME